MRVVQTMRGVIPRDQLQVAALLQEVPDGLLVTTEWRLLAEGPDGPYVRRDAHVVTYCDPGAQAQATAAGFGRMVECERGGQRMLVPRDQLQVSVVLDESENALFVATEWRIRVEGADGPHVRRDGNGCILATPEVMAAVAQLGPVEPPPAVPGADVTVGLRGERIATEQAQLRV